MLEQLKLLIRSGNPILAIETHDEERAVEILRQTSEALGMPAYEWSVTVGLVRTRPEPAGETIVKGGKASAALERLLDGAADAGLYVFKDLGPHCRDPLVLRQLRDLHTSVPRGARPEQQNGQSDSESKAAGRSAVTSKATRTAAGVPRTPIVLVDWMLPESVRRLAVLLRLALPDAAELEKVVRETFNRIRRHSYYEVTSSLTASDLEQLVQTLRGLTCGEAARVVASAIHDDYALTREDLPRIVEAKRNLLESAGCLESVTVNLAVDEMGGLDGLKRWLARRRGGMSSKARAFGLSPPRGILLLGVQGCGKSLCAKAVAADWKMPLLRMDPGVLYQKYIGESENRLREALAQAESMAPAVLWIDEIEKAFASASATSSDGGLSQRMFGSLLSWMQDHRSPIFMVATANDIAALPPELMRKGRFDEVFFVDLPGPAVRRQIFAIHLKRRNRDAQAFRLDELSAATEGFSGAEIEQLVNSALYAAFAEGIELTDEHLQAEAAATRPLSVLMSERIAQLRAWAHCRCVSAD